MPPSQRVRPSPYDKFTDASATAVSSGFSAAMALGPQPKMQKKQADDNTAEGSDYLRNLQKASGFNKNEFPFNETSSSYANGIAGEDEDLSDEDDGDSEEEGKRKGKKPKAKTKGGKASNDDSTAAQRKAQNRVAQREFRQRKQQYIRALEARVELLSSDHDTQVDRLRYALRGLLAENNQLRSLLGYLTAFVGNDMLGGPLQKAGMSRKELESIILSSSEKTLTERWEGWPGARECEVLNEIRLEANLPAEGLPESHRYHQDSSPSIKSVTSETAVSNSSQGRNGVDLSKAKRKSTSDEKESTIGQQQQKQQKVNGGKESTSPQVNKTYNSKDQMQNPASDYSVMSRMGANGQNANYNSFYSQVEAPTQYNAASNGMPNVTVNPMLDGLNVFSPSTPSGDSNAILASLFGSGNMPSIFGQSPSSNFMPFGSSTPYGDTSYDSGTGRQRTIANVEEPEGIKRISMFADKLKRGEHSPGKEIDIEQVSGAVKGISQLIHQMDHFRRQPSFQLPSLLLPCDIQQTRPHDPLIDSLPFSGLRQRLILLQDGLVMDDILMSLLKHIKLHSDDATDVQNWELDAAFYLEHRQLLDRDTLEITNSWRSRRDEKPLSFAHLSSNT